MAYFYSNTKYVPLHVWEHAAEDLVSRGALPAQIPPKPRIRAEVEPPTTNLTLYGTTPNIKGALGGEPPSYSSEHWESFSHAQFRPLPVSAVSKELQLQRNRFQLKSDIPIKEDSLVTFDPSVGFGGRESHHTTDFRPLDREWYVNRPPSYSIGGTGASENGQPTAAQCKTKSDVCLKETERNPPTSYQTLTKRQFQPYHIDADSNRRDKLMRLRNKADMVASHYNLAYNENNRSSVAGYSSVDKGDQANYYRSVASVMIPSTKPTVKGKVVDTAPTTSANPHLVTDTLEARPNKGANGTLTAKEEAVIFGTRSHIPILTKNNPEYYQYSPHVTRGEDGSIKTTGSSWPATVTQSALPEWIPNRRGKVGSANETCSSHVKLGDERPALPGRKATPDPLPPVTPAQPAQRTTSLGLYSDMDSYNHTINRRSMLAVQNGGGVSKTYLSSACLGVSGIPSSTEPTNPHAKEDASRWVSSTKAAFRGYKYQP